MQGKYSPERNKKQMDMTLYEIDARIAQALEELNDEDGVINEEAEALLKKLEEEDRPAKIENCVLFIKNKRAQAAAIREEEIRLAARRHRFEKQAENVENMLAASLNGERFETARAVVTWRKSRAVEVDPGAEGEWDDDQISRFLVFSHRIDKKALAEAVKAGEEVQGVRIVERENIQVEGA